MMLMSDIKQAMKRMHSHVERLNRPIIFLTPAEKAWHDANPGYLPANADVVVSKPIPLGKDETKVIYYGMWRD